MAVGTKLMDVKGKLGGLVRKVNEDGGESWSFKITGDDLQAWEKLKLVHGDRVVLTIEAAQGELELDGKNAQGLPRGVKPGSKAAEGSAQAQD